MAQASLFRDLVHGVRQVLTVNLLVSIVAIAMIGWTLGVSEQLLRERDRLRARVVQLEQTLGANGVAVPPQPAVVANATPGADAYPGELGLTVHDDIDLGEIVSGLFKPPPDLQVVGLHVRDETDRDAAEALAETLRQSGLEVHVRVMTRQDVRRPPAYAYFDGRQSAAAASLMTRFHDLARIQGLAPWTAQLRGVALPAQGEYTAERLDIVLPALPDPPPPSSAASAQQP